MNNVIKIRREIHKNPELGFEEHKTADYICNKLEEIGVPYERNIAKTGVVAIIKGEKVGKTLAIRADMDAIEIAEENSCDYRSQICNQMHACGHDAHVAILLTACEIINSVKEKLCGNVKFIFQPAEEVLGGALPMIEAGVLDNPKVDCCIALHMWPELECGFIEVKDGLAYASPDNFEVVIKGKGGHGAMPDVCVDPVVTGANLIIALQTIASRTVEPFEPFVLSVCSFEAGKEYNVIPESATLRGTVRTFSARLRDKLPNIIENIIKNICAANNADYDFRYIYRYPPVLNDKNMAEMVYEAGKSVVGDKALWGGKPTMCGEDFSYFSEKVPAAIFRLGCRNEEKGIIHPLHSPKFDIDENSLEIGVNVLVEFTKKYLK